MQRTGHCNSGTALFSLQLSSSFIFFVLPSAAHMPLRYLLFQHPPSSYFSHLAPSHTQINAFLLILMPPTPNPSSGGWRTLTPEPSDHWDAACTQPHKKRKKNPFIPLSDTHGLALVAHSQHVSRDKLAVGPLKCTHR